ncbi:RNA-directed DNA polymerase, eukaryota, Nucleotide-binding alpha-beta plait domain protein [Artemisia annua]|uniref:RNA-directed DNA polymerase, eukaryota, Nucleotide-binding alpha-beta plait domain protein n=1 Tax=Artemisia annua TaxID=35608 RepID=A0A2U1PUQ6_ARTAN|nr:RNA-directed DNA polymerase, eukaryota, Nucleotide-binding alpha-beta plait domain protein [Artemisia annua]
MTDDIPSSTVQQSSDSRSFLDTLLNKEVGVGIPEINIEGDIGAFGEYYERGVVVKVKGYSELMSLRSLLRAWSQLSIQIHYVGGFNALLVFRDKMEKDSFLENKVGWEVFLESCVAWNGQIVEFERIAWLKIHGVPLTLSKPQVFDVIASNFGKVIQSAQFEEEGKDLSYAMVGVLVNKVERIKHTCVIKWHKVSCKVSVEEEEACWIPDCIVDLEEEDDCDVVMESPIVDKEKNNGTEEGEIIMENQGSNEGGRGEHASDHVNSKMHVNEESNSQSAEGSRSTFSKKKRRMGTKKKSSLGRDNSNSNPDRPKKRLRDGNDPFDIDRFIFSDVSTPLKVVEVNVQDGEFLTPDLNREVQQNNEEGDIENLNEGLGLPINVEAKFVQNREVRETIALAKVLGVENMGNFEDSIVQEVSKEGVQLGDQ